MRTIFFFLIIFFSLSNYSQERKSFDAVRFISPPKIDGKLNDDQWIKSPELKDFILAFPSTGLEKKFHLIMKQLLTLDTMMMQFILLPK